MFQDLFTWKDTLLLLRQTNACVVLQQITASHHLCKSFQSAFSFFLFLFFSFCVTLCQSDSAIVCPTILTADFKTYEGHSSKTKSYTELYTLAHLVVFESLLT